MNCIIQKSRTLSSIICYSTTTSRLTNSAYIPTQSTQSHELYFIWKSRTLSSKNHSCCSTTKSRWQNSSYILTLWISMSRTISSEGHELYHLKNTAASQPQRVGGQSFEYIPPKSFQFYEIYFIWKSRTLSSENQASAQPQHVGGKIRHTYQLNEYNLTNSMFIWKSQTLSFGTRSCFSTTRSPWQNFWTTNTSPFLSPFSKSWRVSTTLQNGMFLDHSY